MFQTEFGIRFPLVHADAERTPLRDESFDLAISEYGASIWCDPYGWIPEAARILRRGGELVFLGRSYLSMLTSPDGDLPRPSSCSAISSACIGSSGLTPTEPSSSLSPDPLATAEWSRRWPIEEVWRARKAG